MCKRIISILITAIFCMITLVAHAAETGTEIMAKVYNRYDGDTRVSRQSISTCKYGINNKKIECIETPRVKVSENYGKDYGEKGQDSKSLTLIVEPASDRGIGILQYDYDDVQREADQWIYLSALGKPKRVASGNQDDDEPKKGSMFGSEFALEDMEKIRVNDYNISILAELEYRDKECWVIQLAPTPSRARRSNYSKMISWVDKERFVEHKVQYYDRKGVYVKKKTQVNWERNDNIWFAKELIMDNRISKRISIMATRKVVYNVDISDEFFTLRSLTDSSFRERNLSKLKSHFDENAIPDLVSKD